MENNTMSASFFSICGNTYNASEREAWHAALESKADNYASENDNGGFLEVNQKDFQDQSALEAFESIVNATNCANTTGKEILEGYYTVTPGTSLKAICIDFPGHC